MRGRPTRDAVRASVPELLVALVVVGFLGVLSVPLYHRLHERARRSEAEEYLVELARDVRTWTEERRTAGGPLRWPVTLDTFTDDAPKRFVFTITDGAGRDASRFALRLEAVGRPGGRLDDLRLSRTVAAFRGARRLQTR